MAALDYVPVVQQLYISYFGRPADYFGLKNFTEQLDAMGAPKTFVELNAAAQADKAGTSPLSKLVNSFSSSPESANLYGTDNSNLGISKFLVSVFQNVLGVTPELGPGWDFWFNAIASGSLRRADAAMAITEGAITNTSAQGLINAKTVANKLEVATSFTNALDTPAKINAYAGQAAVDAASGLLENVTSTTDTVAYQATVAAAVNTIVEASLPVTNTALTTGVDTIVGTTNNEVVNGTLATTGGTLSALDTIDGGTGGNDTLNVNILNTGLTLDSSIIVKNIDTVAVRSAFEVDIDGSAWTNVGAIKVTQATTADVVAAGTTNVSVAGATGAVDVEGGAAVTIDHATANAAVEVTDATGTVAVTHTKLGTANVNVETEGAVTVKASGLGIQAGDAVTVGAAGGAVVVDTTGAAYAAAAVGQGDISITGGTTIAVTQTPTSSSFKTNNATADVTNIGAEITLGDVTIVGGDDTTEVTVTQTAAVAAKDGVAAEAATAGTQTATFTAVAANDVVTFGGLTFTASKALTAAQVAAAFSNLSKGAVQGTGAAGNGIYSGTFSADFSTGPVVVSGTAQTVVATTTVAAAVALTVGATGVTVGTLTAADEGTELVTGVMGVVGGAVEISSGDGKISKVTIDGFGAASSITSDDLVTLSLAHSNSDLTITNTKATTLALTVNGLGIDSDFATLTDANDIYKTVTITTATADSYVAAALDGVEALTINGSNAIDLTGSALSALKTLVIAGAAGVTDTDTLAASVTSVDASATSGDVSLKIDAATAAYKGGSGSDSVILATATTTKAVTLGAGDDSLTLATGTTTLTAAMAGGDGTDTLVMVAADAATASGATTFEAKISGFEKLSLTGTTTNTVDLDNLDDISYVITSGATALTLDNLASGGTIEHTATATLVTANVTDADTGTADVLNVVVKNTAGIVAGEVVAEDVETINVTVTDTTTSSIGTHSLTLTDAALTTVKITGNAGLTLTLDAGNDAVKMIDGSAMTKGLTAATDATAGDATIKGGAGADNLTANGEGDTLIGGAGADTLIVNNDLVILTGGAGADVFNVGFATTNANGYASITDLTAGDLLEFAGAADFLAAKVTLAGTAVFQDLANKAIATTDAGDVSWFQFGGNTYVVENNSNDTSAFDNGVDAIVQIVGLVDLSKSSLSADEHTLLFV